MLKKWSGKFQAANMNHWKEIVKEAANQIKNAWRENIEFDRGMVIRVYIVYSQLDWADLICFSTLFANICMAMLDRDQRRPLLNHESGHTLMS